LLTDKQTDKQTNKNWQKHNLLDESKNAKAHIPLQWLLSLYLVSAACAQ